MGNLKFALLFTLAPLLSNAQANLTLGELDKGILPRYHTLLTHPGILVLGEKHELDVCINDFQNQGVMTFNNINRLNYNLSRFNNISQPFKTSDLKARVYSFLSYYQLTNPLHLHLATKLTF